jgi:hypothetical protein
VRRLRCDKIVLDGRHGIRARFSTRPPLATPPSACAKTCHGAPPGLASLPSAGEQLTGGEGTDGHGA